jgi:hypothetical protein
MLAATYLSIHISVMAAAGSWKTRKAECQRSCMLVPNLNFMLALLYKAVLQRDDTSILALLAVSGTYNVCTLYITSPLSRDPSGIYCISLLFLC